MSDLDKTGREWLMARTVIVQWIADLTPAILNIGSLEDAAAALLARLAQHSPPLLLVTQTDLDAAEARKALLRKALEECLPLVNCATIIHHLKPESHRWQEVDGELVHWLVREGCKEDCPGCARIVQRDAVLAFARAAFGSEAEGETR